MYLLDFPCLQECVDALHQVASSSCPRLELLAVLSLSNFPGGSMCLLDFLLRLQTTLYGIVDSRSMIQSLRADLDSRSSSY